MYESYFGLTERPFSIAPDPQYLYMSTRHKEAMGHLSYGLSQGGCFIVLTGEVGTGKTTLCRNLLSDLPDNVDVALILNANINEQELLQTICDEFGIDYLQQTSQKQLLDSINRHLLEIFAENRHAVLIIDEAQLLSRDVLEQIRLLTNLETTKSKLLQIILIGQPELNDLLTRNDLRQLAQRVTARYHLGALQRSEIEDYVNFRLAVAGCKKPLFSRQALNKLHALTEGIPRKINVLADHGLLAAYSKGEALVNAKIIKSAAGDVFIENGPGAKALKTDSKWLSAAAIAGVLVLLNIALWWFFSQPPSDAKSSVPAVKVTPTEAEKKRHSEPEIVSVKPFVAANVNESIVDKSTFPSSSVDANGKGLTEPEGVKQNIEVKVDQELPLAEDQSGQIKPGTVILSDQLLDAGAELPVSIIAPEARQVNELEVSAVTEQQASRASDSQNDIATAITPTEGSSYSANASPFTQLLETSADLTGRISAFRELASIWDESLPSSLIKPVCDQLQTRSLSCLYVTDWTKLINFNRQLCWSLVMRVVYIVSFLGR